MPTFSASTGNTFAPATTADNFTLSPSAANIFGKIVMIGWGGAGATSAGYRTRWARPTANGTTTTTSGVAAAQPNYPTNGVGFITAWATQPTLPATGVGNLWAQDWNVQGGVGVIVMPLANPWWVVGTASGTAISQSLISCRNEVGTDSGISSYSVSWEE